MSVDCVKLGGKLFSQRLVFGFGGYAVVPYLVLVAVSTPGAVAQTSLDHHALATA